MDVIKDFMSTPVLSVNVQTTVEETAKVMEEKGISCLLVKENEGPVGLITTSDLVKRVIARGLDPKTTEVHSIMSKPLITLNHYLTRSDANELMQRNKIKHLAVTEQNSVIGILTPKDMIS
ncbi:MAG: CBS domain-containing protein [Nitrospina sp.]|jgi:signal-transduction protein with cAMP-binding, CBS, and nucleotidyltransferase domain|nr:CBS domain-containing protein [Nitrospina sp.]MBT6717188.1 CBS domain-containing protein [Nitrospina sp.]